MAFERIGNLLGRGESSTSGATSVLNYIKMVQAYQQNNLDKLLSELPEKMQDMSINLSETSRKDFIDIAVKLDLIRSTLEKSGITDVGSLSGVNQDLIDKILREKDLSVKQMTEILSTLKNASQQLETMGNTLSISLKDILVNYKKLAEDSRVDLDYKKQLVEEVKGYVTQTGGVVTPGSIETSEDAVEALEDIKKNQEEDKNVLLDLRKKREEQQEKLLGAWENFSAKTTESTLGQAGRGLLNTALFPILGPFAETVSNATGKIIDKTVGAGIKKLFEKEDKAIQEAEKQTYQSRKMSDKLGEIARTNKDFEDDQDIHAAKTHDRLGEIIENTEGKVKPIVPSIFDKKDEKGKSSFGMMGDWVDSFTDVAEMFTKEGGITGVMATKMAGIVTPALTTIGSLIIPTIGIAVAGLGGLLVGTLLNKFVGPWIQKAGDWLGIGEAKGLDETGMNKDVLLDRWEKSMEPETFKKFVEPLEKAQAEGERVSTQDYVERFTSLKEQGQLIKTKDGKWVLRDSTPFEEGMLQQIMSGQATPGAVVPPTEEAFSPEKLAESVRAREETKKPEGTERPIQVNVPPPIINPTPPPIGRQVQIDDPSLAMVQTIMVKG